MNNDEIEEFVERCSELEQRIFELVKEESPRVVVSVLTLFMAEIIIDAENPKKALDQSIFALGDFVKAMMEENNLR